MKIHIEKLIEILTQHAQWGEDSPPQEAVGITFSEDIIKPSDTITFHLRDGGLLALELDHKRKVLGLEIV